MSHHIEVIQISVQLTSQALHMHLAYASKRLPEAAKSYSIKELQLCGLAINIASFSHVLKRVDFNVIVDHLTLTHIIKSKAEPATPRIRRLLELISLYSFNLYIIYIYKVRI